MPRPEHASTELGAAASARSKLASAWALRRNLPSNDARQIKRLNVLRFGTPHNFEETLGVTQPAGLKRP
jgi:hypothetical protein